MAVIALDIIVIIFNFYLNFETNLPRMEFSLSIFLPQSLRMLRGTRTPSWSHRCLKDPQVPAFIRVFLLMLSVLPTSHVFCLGGCVPALPTSFLQDFSVYISHLH